MYNINPPNEKCVYYILEKKGWKNQVTFQYGVGFAFFA